VSARRIFVTARAVSDYRKPVSGEMKLPFPDGIPVIGGITFLERKRRSRGESIGEFYGPFNPIDMFKDAYRTRLGTSEWPQPSDQQAERRSYVEAARNSVFGVYHTMFLVSPSFYYGAKEIAERLF